MRLSDPSLPNKETDSNNIYFLQLGRIIDELRKVAEFNKIANSLHILLQRKIEEQDIEMLRATLVKILDTEAHYPPKFRVQVYQAAFHTLLILASTWPLNVHNEGNDEEKAGPACPYDFTTIPDDKKIPVSTGYLFNIDNLKTGLTYRPEFNMVTNKAFNKRDLAHIYRKTTAANFPPRLRQVGGFALLGMGFLMDIGSGFTLIPTIYALSYAPIILASLPFLIALPLYIVSVSCITVLGLAACLAAELLGRIMMERGNRLTTEAKADLIGKQDPKKVIEHEIKNDLANPLKLAVINQNDALFDPLPFDNRSVQQVKNTEDALANTPPVITAVDYQENLQSAAIRPPTSPITPSQKGMFSYSAHSVNQEAIRVTGTPTFPHQNPSVSTQCTFQ